MPTILNGDCVQMLRDHVADESVDSIFFSPPYDAMRNYGNDGSPPPFDLSEAGRECFRVLKDGGVAGMVINDGTKDYAKSLTTFRTTIDWCDNAGFRLFETVVYHRKGAPGGWWTRRLSGSRIPVDIPPGSATRLLRQGGTLGAVQACRYHPQGG